MHDFGRMIRINRQAQALTLNKLSHKTGLSISFLSEIERGKSQPSIASLRKNIPGPWNQPSQLN